MSRNRQADIGFCQGSSLAEISNSSTFMILCFELSKPPLCGLGLSSFYFRNDYLGVEQYSRYRDGENYVFLPGLYEQHEQFTRQWDKNLRDQGFLDTFTDQSIRG